MSPVSAPACNRAVAGFAGHVPLAAGGTAAPVILATITTTTTTTTTGRGWVSVRE
ncbi:MAG: hypothetical protein ACREPY_01130 [Rhodanobacteraceae bacterium]